MMNVISSRADLKLLSLFSTVYRLLSQYYKCRHYLQLTDDSRYGLRQDIHDCQYVVGLTLSPTAWSLESPVVWHGHI